MRDVRAITIDLDDTLWEIHPVIHRPARNRVELFPEVRPVLRALREDYRLGAVTNGNASPERIGIDDLFDEFVSARIAGAAKPARQIFEVAVRAGGARPHETLHVGDHPEYDVAGARDAGFRTAWVNWRGSALPGELPAPDAEIAHVGELRARLVAARE